MDAAKESLGHPGTDRRVPWLSLSVLVLGAFMAILQGSAINVALPQLMAVFNVTPDEIQWVLTGYMLVTGVVIPVCGYLGDRFGYKRLYLLALAVFILGSALSGFAWSVNSLVAARVIQALGGGMIMPISMALLYQLAPVEKIGTALGTWGLAMVVAPAIGPTLGGYLVEHFGWRLVFYVNLPVGALAIPLIALMLPETRRREGLRFDFPGFLLAVAGCFTLLLALSEGQDKGWGSQYIVTLLLIAGFTLILFALWELVAPEPMLDVRLFLNPVLTVSTIATGLAAVALFGGVFLVPLFTQTVQGYSALQTGLILMPAALVSGLVMPFAGRLFDRVGAVPLGVTGLGIVAVTTYMLHNLTIDLPARHLQYILAVRSAGLGLCMMPLTTAGMNTVPVHLVGRASALTNTIRQIAASFGIALMTHILETRQAFHAARLAEAVSLDAPAAVVQQMAQNATRGGGGSGQAIVTGDLMMALQKLATVNGMSDAFLVAAALAAATIPLVLFLGRKQVERQRKREAMRWGTSPGPVRAVPAADAR